MASSETPRMAPVATVSSSSLKIAFTSSAVVGRADSSTISARGTDRYGCADGETVELPLDIFELDGIPGFNQDEEQRPPAKIAELKQRIREADAVLIVTPEDNYSVPGALKNAIDWASRPYGDSAWSGKPAAIMGASVGSNGTARARYHCARCSSSGTCSRSTSPRS